MIRHILLSLSFFLTFCSGVHATSDSAAPLTVKVSDFEGNPKGGEAILFVGKKSGAIIKGISDEQGLFEIALFGGDIYDIKIKEIGDEIEYNTIEIPLLEEGYSYREMELTIKFESSKKFTLNNIYFDSGKSNLRPNSEEQLKDLLDYMSRRKDLVIKINGHTDNIGDDTANLSLSLNRANAVKTYLISNGISSSRINTKGFGESEPVALNTAPEGRQQNRRIEIEVL